MWPCCCLAPDPPSTSHGSARHSQILVLVGEQPNRDISVFEADETLWGTQNERRAHCVAELAQVRRMVGHDGRPQPHRGNHDHRVDDVGRLGPTTCNAGCPRRSLPRRSRRVPDSATPDQRNRARPARGTPLPRRVARAGLVISTRPASLTRRARPSQPRRTASTCTTAATVSHRGDDKVSASSV